MKVIDVNNGLNTEELLWKLAMKRIKDHLKNILLTSALDKAIFVPNLCNKVAEDFTLQITDLLAYRETFNNWITSTFLNDSMN